MHIEQILEVLKQPNISHYLTEMSQVHMYTKHYLLIAEELSEEGVAFLQPLKEHRDAYDHISRIFSLSLKDGNNEERDDEAYILDNVRKAFGHEYRAFLIWQIGSPIYVENILEKNCQARLKRKSIKKSLILRILSNLLTNYHSVLLNLGKEKMLVMNNQYWQKF